MRRRYAVNTSSDSDERDERKLVDLYLDQLVKSKAITGYDDPVACCDDDWRVTVKIARPPGLIKIRFGIKAAGVGGGRQRLICPAPIPGADSLRNGAAAPSPPGGADGLTSSQGEKRDVL